MPSAISKKGLHSAVLTALLVALIAGGLPMTTAQEDLPPVELTYYTIGWTVNDVELVEEKVNELIQPKINATLDLNIIEWGSYAEKMKLLAASGEPCDLMLLESNNPYAPAVANGAILQLDDLLPEYAPHVWESISASTWDAARIGGKIYGIPIVGLQGMAYGIWLRKDLMEKYNFDWTQARSWEDLEPLFAAIAENEPEVKIFSAANYIHGRLWFPEAWGVDPIGGPERTIGIRMDDETLTVINAVASEEYRKAAEITKRWYDAGYFPAEPPPSGDVIAARAAGLVSGMIWNYIPGWEYFASTGEYGGREIVQLVFTKPVMTTGSAAGAFTGVCATSQNPERALMLVDLIFTDPYLMNTLIFGVEGVHWVWDDQAQNLIKVPEGKTKDEINAAYRSNIWAWGPRANVYYAHPSEIGSVEKILELNETATPSAALGLRIDYTPVRTEFAQVEAVAKQYGDPIERGMVEDLDAAIAEYLAKLEEAGIDKIIEEAQRQANEWAATRSG